MDISSLAGIRWTGYPYAGYCAAKAGENQLTVRIASKSAGDGMGGEAIVPGQINTPLTHLEVAGQSADSAGMLRARGAACAMGRVDGVGGAA